MLPILLIACLGGRTDIGVTSVGRPPELPDTGLLQGEELSLRGGQSRSWRIVVASDAHPGTTHLWVDAAVSELRGDTVLSAELHDWDEALRDAESEATSEELLLTTEVLDLFDGLCEELRCELSLTYTLALEGEGNVDLAWDAELTQPFADGEPAEILLIEELPEAR